MKKGRRNRSRRVHRLASLRAPARRKDARSSESTISRTGRWRISARVSLIPASASRRSTAHGGASSASPSTGATRSRTSRRRRFRASAAQSRRSRSTWPAFARPALSRSPSDADLIVTSTSDVYGNGTPPLAEDDELVLGPSTTRRWAYAVSKMYDEHLALALAEERGLRVTVLRLFNVLRAEQPPQLVGRACRDVRRGAARRRADDDPRRRQADPDVHVRQRHRRRVRPCSARRRRLAAR